MSLTDPFDVLPNVLHKLFDISKFLDVLIDSLHLGMDEKYVALNGNDDLAEKGIMQLSEYLSVIVNDCPCLAEEIFPEAFP